MIIFTYILVKSVMNKKRNTEVGGGSTWAGGWEYVLVCSACCKSSSFCILCTLTLHILSNLYLLSILYSFIVYSALKIKFCNSVIVFYSMKFMFVFQNEARKLNHQEVVEEDRRDKLPTNIEAKKRRVEWEEEEDRKRKVHLSSTILNLADNL